jgi:DNA end-binding protein Ku
MPRGIWSGTVSFGLVAIPVSLVPAVRPPRAGFRLLHDKDHAPLRREMVCPAHNAPVAPSHMVRGFEIKPGHYVTVTDEEIRALEPKRSRTIEITEFVAASAIDPIYYDRPYYLLPDGAEKPYRLLVRALAEEHRAGIARFVLYDREHLVALRGMEGLLCLFLLHFDDEIAAADGLAAKAAAPAKDVKTIEKLIRDMSGPFNPRKYPNREEEKLKKLIASKEKKGSVVEAPEVEEEGGEPAAGEGVSDDFISVLEGSIARAKARRGRLAGSTRSRHAPARRDPVTGGSRSRPARARRGGNGQNHRPSRH